MDNPQITKLSLKVFLLAALLLPFQNCVPALNDNQKTQVNKSTSSSTLLGGNGEGYTGKLTGTYASLDTQNMCGGNSGAMYKVMDEVKVQSNEFFYTVKNCQPLAIPERITQPTVTKVESKGSLFVLGTQMFQQGAFIPFRQAESDEFVDFFCSGFEGTDVSPNVKRMTELTMYMSTETIFNIPILFNQSLRRGRLRLIDINKNTDKVVASTVIEFDPMMQTLINETDSGTRVLAIYNVDGPHDLSMTYVDVDGMAPFQPTTIDYSINNGPLRSASPVTCYRTY